jgi:ubiquitin-like domain-containing CTD phosphatase 1
MNETETETSSKVTLIAKFAKERIALEELDGSTTIGQVKDILWARTKVLPKRQKLVGLVAISGGSKGVHDDLPLSDLKSKGKAKQQFEFILMGTPEEDIFVDPGDRDDLPEVLDDFDLEFNAGSTEWLQHKANEENLRKFSAETEFHIMNPPRPGRPLLVLDLDHTLLDFSKTLLQNSSRESTPGEGVAATMKRPHMDEFLTQCYRYYDLVVWSQTSWRWLETKLIELGMVTHPGYKFCFVLDKTSMFTIESTKRDGTKVQHHVKPLQIIWSRFADRWGSQNTVHIDDLSRNFALNLGSGLKCSPYHRKKSKAPRDAELLGIGTYLVKLALSGLSFNDVDFSKWQEVVSENKAIIKETKNNNGK